MSYPLKSRARAKLDIAEIALYLAEQSVTAAEKFMHAVQESLAFLQDWPESAALVDMEPFRAQGIRISVVRGFRHYLIIYRFRNETVELLRITHASRDQTNLLEDLSPSEPS